MTPCRPGPPGPDTAGFPKRSGWNGAAQAGASGYVVQRFQKADVVPAIEVERLEVRWWSAARHRRLKVADVARSGRRGKPRGVGEGPCVRFDPAWAGHG